MELVEFQNIGGKVTPLVAQKQSAMNVTNSVE